LRAFVAAEVLQLVAALAAEQVLNGMKIRRGVRLDRNAVGRPQAVEIKRGHDRGERGGGCLMPAHLQPVGIFAHMIGVMDGPTRQPQHLALKLGEDRQVARKQG
jgi:hypothetical protein